MSASNSASAALENQDRFQPLTPACLSRSEKSSVVKLALAVLSSRYRPGRAFTAPEDIEGFLRLKLTGRRNEVFGVIYLDTRHRFIDMEELFNGTVDGAAVYPRVVVQRALEKNAAALVAFHNHPGSQISEPSEADRGITLKLGRALDLIDVRLLDHLVVTDKSFVSLAQRGWI